jgi:hypothetical protein
MPRVLRSRSRSVTISGSTTIYGTPNWTGAGAITNISAIRNQACTDYRGRPISPSDFVSDQRNGAPTWSGRIKNAVSSRTFDNYPLVSGNGGLSDVDVQPLPAPKGWQLSAVARSNPSRPVVTPPEMIQNIVELPRLLRDTYRVLTDPRSVHSAKGVANAYLGFKFGWAPMLKDLEDIMDLGKHVERRNRELNSLYSGKGLRRRLTFGSDTKVSDFYVDVALSGAGTYVRLFHSQICEKKSWATVRWKPLKPPPYHPSDSRNLTRIRQIILGLIPEGMSKGLWAVVPWTWLIGWFTNNGDYFLANSNTVPATFTEACFMSSSVTTTKGSQPRAVNCEIISLAASGSASRSIKTRVAGNGVLLPGVNMPYLGVSKLSVLAALGAQRGAFGRR